MLSYSTGKHPAQAAAICIKERLVPYSYHFSGDPAPLHGHGMSGNLGIERKNSPMKSLFKLFIGEETRGLLH